MNRQSFSRESRLTPDRQRAPKKDPILVVHDFASWGGAEFALRDLVIELLAAGHPVDFICFAEGPLPADLRSRGVTVHIVPFAREFVRFSQRPLFVDFMRLLFRVPSLVRDGAAICRLMRRQSDALVLSNSLKSVLVTRPLSFMLRMSHFHFLHYDLARGFGPKPIATSLLLLMKSCARVICVSSAALEAFLALGGDPRRATVVRQSIHFPQDNGRNYDVNRLVIGTVGRINEFKNVGQIVTAVALLRERGLRIELRIVGDSFTEADHRYKRQLEQQVEAHGLTDLVHFVGFRQEIWPVLSEMDIFVSTSRNESLGRSVLEAMGMGLPVIVTPVGGLAESVQNGQTGLWTKLDDPDDLVGLIARLVNSPDERRRLGQAASKAVRSQYSPEEYREAIGVLFTGVRSS